MYFNLIEEIMLTIAIPTYNRHEKLYKTLSKLSELMGSWPIKIIIIDNFSTPSVAEYLAEKNYKGFNYTEIHKNNSNIGLGANLLMCFVHTSTEWLWLLGDDDLPVSACLENIFCELSKAGKNDFLIKFNSQAGDFPEHDTIISNEEEFVQFCSNMSYYSNILFISNSIFRTKMMQKHLRLMYEYTNTLAPHIIGILKNVSEVNQIRIINKYISEHGVARGSDAWDHHRLCEGVLYFSDLKGHPLFKYDMVKNLFLNYFSHNKFYSQLFLYPFRYENLSLDYWRWFYWKSAFLFSGMKSRYLLFLSRTIKFYYNLRLLNSIISKRIKVRIVTNLERC
jgi:hypothetical protein